MTSIPIVDKWSNPSPKPIPDPKCPVARCYPDPQIPGLVDGSLFTRIPRGCPIPVCAPRPTPTKCPKIYKPVCGSNGVTYGNSCEARAAGASVVSEGRCGSAGGVPIDDLPSDCWSTPPITRCGGGGVNNYRCMIRPQPVCAKNGRTYQSLREALCAGTEVDYPGYCQGTPKPPSPLPPPPQGCNDTPTIMCDLKTATTYHSRCAASLAGATNIVHKRCIPVGPHKPGQGPGPVKPGPDGKPNIGNPVNKPPVNVNKPGPVTLLGNGGGVFHPVCNDVIL